MSKAKNKEEIFIGMIKAGIFEIDDDGRIWRLAARNAWHTIKPVMRRRAEYQGCRHNYLVLQASIAGKKVIALAHRIIWIYLHSTIPVGLEINHKDGDRTNNNPANLELVTASENQKHSYRVTKTHHPNIGSKNPFSKLTEEGVKNIRTRAKEGERLMSIAKSYRVSYYTIWDVVSGRHWQHVKEAV